MTLVVPLADVRSEDAGRVGTKAANLGDLIAAGFTVPDGIVVTTAAFRKFLPTVGPNELPADVADAIVEALGPLADEPVAVRSSAVGEDLEDASFAGQYQTVLDVRGVEAILEAVLCCFSSAAGDRVRAYREERGLEPSDVAVLVQRLVPATAAGVVFSANPVTGARDECLLNAVRGLGDRLVSGEVTPDEWVVRAQRAEARITPEQALTAAQAVTVARLAERVQAHFGTPQDAEWAFNGDALWLLQSRPITALPEPPVEPVAPVPMPIEPPPGTWEREASEFPDPPCPLFKVFFERVGPTLKTSLGKSDLLIEGIEYVLIGGNVYKRLLPLGGPDTKPPPAWLVPIIMPVLRRVLPALKERIARCTEAVRSDRFYRTIEAWRARERQEVEASNALLGGVELGPLCDDALVDHLEQIVDRVNAMLAIHMRIVVAWTICMAEFVRFAREVLGWDEKKVMELCSGTSEVSTGPGRALAALAASASEAPRILALLERPVANIEARLEQTDSDFWRAWQGFKQAWGRRSLQNSGILMPTLAECPELIASLILGQLRSGHDPDALDDDQRARHEALMDEARAVLADRPAELVEFERLLARARRTYPEREDNTFHTLAVPIALWRYAALEIGRRLSERGVLERTGDVFFLEHDEVGGALADTVDRRALVRHRRGEHAWASQAELPPIFGVPHPEPPMSWMPPEVRFTVESVMWTLDRIFESQRSGREQDDVGGIDGIGASSGSWEGFVRVIASEHEFEKVLPGDVLVCVATSPVWSILFPSIGALVTDAGGLLSHQAIIAREYRIPAVVATGNATELLRDGQRVRVDGDSGLVTVLT